MSMPESAAPRWARALSGVLPRAWRAEILDDLVEERRVLTASGRGRLSSAIWLATQILRSARDSRHRESLMDNASTFETVRGLPRELRHAARGLLRAPAFTVVAFLLLALGIGATVAMSTVLESVVLRPLPYVAPDQLVALMHPAAAPGSGERKWGLSVAGYFEFRRESKSFADLGVYRTWSYTVAGDGASAEEVRVAVVTHTFFTTVGTRPHLGALFSEEADRPRAPAVAVLSYPFWLRRYGGDRSVVGRTLQTSIGSRLIVGVAEPGANLPRPGPFASTADLSGFGVDVWEPLRLDPNAPAQNNHAYSGIARLRSGVSAQQAEAELRTIVAQFPQRFPSAYSERFVKSYNFRVSVTPLLDEVLGPTVARSLWTLFGAVGFVLIIACANVANLCLVRAGARSREAGIRSALGAARGHLARQYLTEGLLLTITAGAVGVALAYWSLPWLLSVAPEDVPRLGSTSIGWRTLVFAGLTSVVAGLAFGLIPLTRLTGAADALRPSGRGLTSSRSQRFVRSGLVVGQVALAVVLLAAAGLLVRSVVALKNVQPGLNPAGVLAFEVSLPFDKYPTLESAIQFHRELQASLEALPGVTRVGASTAMPLRDYGTGCAVVFREARPYSPEERTPCVAIARTTPGFFDAMGIRVRGRAPDWADIDSRSQAAVITQALADRLWPGEDPIGKGINSNGNFQAPPGMWYRIVGVIPELRAYALDQPPAEAMFYAATDVRTPSRAGDLHGPVYTVKTTLADPMALAPAVRSAVAAQNAQVPVIRPQRMTDVVDHSIARASFSMLLLGLASAMAILLSAVGLYGVIAYVVAQRRSEIGIRMALGARAAQLSRWVVGQSLALAAIGVAVGAALALLTARLVESYLFQVDPIDPVVLALAVVTLLGVAGRAARAPARRAARVDPGQTLRN
jgi:predicted permease